MFLAHAAVVFLEVEQENNFLRSIENLPKDQKEKMIYNRKKQKTEERRHRELCQAIRDSKQGLQYFY